MHKIAVMKGGDTQAKAWQLSGTHAPVAGDYVRLRWNKGDNASAISPGYLCAAR